MERSEECLLVLKTLAEALPLLEEWLLELHSYDCPEFIAIAADRVSADYAAWVEASVEIPTPPA
jgi:uncharacterized protein involved in tolerance to divalent cations